MRVATGGYSLADFFATEPRRVLATLHAAHKANRLLYHLLLHQEPYSSAQHH
jgi:hypothetical protein